MPSKGFFFSSNLRFGGRQSNITTGLTHWTRKDSFPVSRALEGKCQHLNGFCDILLQDLTPLSSQDYEGYEFVKSLSEETQIMDLFTHCKAYSIRSQLI